MTSRSGVVALWIRACAQSVWPRARPLRDVQHALGTALARIMTIIVVIVSDSVRLDRLSNYMRMSARSAASVLPPSSSAPPLDINMYSASGQNGNKAAQPIAPRSLTAIFAAGADVAQAAAQDGTTTPPHH